jgi:hypothetical protein
MALNLTAWLNTWGAFNTYIYALEIIFKISPEDSFVNQGGRLKGTLKAY